MHELNRFGTPVTNSNVIASPDSDNVINLLHDNVINSTRNYVGLHISRSPFRGFHYNNIISYNKRPRHSGA